MLTAQPFNTVFLDVQHTMSFVLLYFTAAIVHIQIQDQEFHVLQFHILHVQWPPQRLQKSSRPANELPFGMIT